VQIHWHFGRRQYHSTWPINLIERGFATVNGYVRRVAMQLFNMAGVAATAMAAGADMELACTHPRDDEPAYYLNANPQESFELWDEYINGVRGRKPSRLFLEPEQGRVKY
jgi:hypothetical protein